MVDAGVTHVICEVTAHALDQYRFKNCNFEISAITNTSHEHLDYFHDMDKYIKTKAKIFNQSKFSVLNKDDPSYPLINQLVNNKFSSSYSIEKKSNYQATNIKISEKSLSFTINGLTLKTDSNYHYQIYNILTALVITDHLKINPQFLIETIKEFPYAKGRREEITNNLKIKTIIDFAHTPHALQNTLSSLKKNTSGKLIVIFGATGGRDQSKRPLMGQIASELADIAIITADDTRNEKIEDINNQIIDGINQDSIFINNLSDFHQIKKTLKDSNKFVYFNIPNRQDAFNFAIKLAQPNDTIVACGKGHEDTILQGNTEYPWSESEAFRSAFKIKELSK